MADRPPRDADFVFQHRYHAVFRLSLVSIQQEPLLCMDGHVQAAFWHRRHYHDLLVGSRYHASQWG